MICDGDCEEKTAIEAENEFAVPVVHFGESCSGAKCNSRLSKTPELSDFIKVLTMERWSQSKVLGTLSITIL